MDFRKTLKILKERRWTFLLVTLMGLGFVVATPNQQITVAPVYNSYAKILLTPSSATVRAYGGNVAAGGDITQSWFADQTILQELLQSEELLSRVTQQSDKQIPWFQLRDQIQLESLSADGRGTKLFKLGVTDADPKEAQKLTRLVADEFINYVQELSAQEFANTRRFIEELVLEAEQRRISADEALMAVREKYLGQPSDEEIATRVQALETERQELQREIGSIRAEVASISTYTSGNAGSIPWAVRQQASTALGGLESNLAEQKLELAKLKEVYKDDSDVVKAAQARLENAERVYHTGLDEYVSSLQNDKSSRLQTLLASSQSLTTQLNDLLKSKMDQEDRRVVAKLDRERTLWEENHLSLLQQLYQARVVEQSSKRQGSVNILEQPRLGTPIANGSAPAATSQTKRLAFAIPFCLLLGAGAAFLRDYLTSSLRLRPRIEEALELPVIAVIPSTPSELTVDWERFKRPLGEALDLLPRTKQKL